MSESLGNNQSAKPAEKSESSTIRVESYKLGKLDITAILTDHNPKNLKEHLKVYEGVIPEVNLVIPEYFTPEWSRLKGDTVLQEYTKIGDNLAYFGGVEKVIAKQDKPVLVLDPAHDKNFALINLAYAAEIGGGVGGLIAAAHGMRREENKKPEGKLSRRNFLKMAAVGSFGLALGGVSNFASYLVEMMGRNPSTFPPNEATFRRTIISQGLVQFAAQQEKPIKVAIIYPEVHWRQIKDFFTNPIRQVYFGAFSGLLKGNPALKESFFTGRKYRWDRGQWTKSGQFEIS